MIKANGRVESMLTDSSVRHLEELWPSITDLIHVPQTMADYDQLVQLLDHLLEQVGQDETHPLSSLLDVVGVLVSTYETGNPELDWELQKFVSDAPDDQQE